MALLWLQPRRAQLETAEAPRRSPCPPRSIADVLACIGPSRSDPSPRARRLSRAPATPSERLDMRLAPLVNQPAPSAAVDGDVRAPPHPAVRQATQRPASESGPPASRTSSVVALPREDLIGYAQRARHVRGDFDRLDPRRSSASCLGANGRARPATSGGAARALLTRAKTPDDGVDVLAPQVRASTALARHDPARAWRIVQEVLVADASALPRARPRGCALPRKRTAGRRPPSPRRTHRTHLRRPGSLPALGSASRIAGTRDARSRSTALNRSLSARALEPPPPAHSVPPAEIALVLGTRTTIARARTASPISPGRSSRDDRARSLVRPPKIDDSASRTNESRSALRARAGGDRSTYDRRPALARPRAPAR